MHPSEVGQGRALKGSIVFPSSRDPPRGRRPSTTEHRPSTRGSHAAEPPPPPAHPVEHQRSALAADAIALLHFLVSQYPLLFNYGHVAELSAFAAIAIFFLEQVRSCSRYADDARNGDEILGEFSGLLPYREIVDRNGSK